MFREQCKLVNYLMLHTNTTFYSEKIWAIGKDQKKLLVATNTLLNRNNNTKLPTPESQSKVAERFAMFFAKKIRHIHSELSSNTVPQLDHVLDNNF